METITIRPRTAKTPGAFSPLPKKAGHGGETEARDAFWEKVRKHADMPAAMTEEELRAKVARAAEDLKNGKGIKHEDVMREIKTWR